MKLLNDKIEKQLREMFAELGGDVTIALFTEGDCPTCTETTDYMQEVVALSDKIHLKNYSLSGDAELAERFHVDRAPSIVLLDPDGNYRGVKFIGIPAGHEVNSFISAIFEVSGVAEALPEELENRIKAIDKPVNIKVFVTLSCPHCPGAVQKAHRLALMNDNVEAEMIEAQTFMELSNRFNVSGVPKIVINDDYELVGNQPLDAFLSTIEGIK